MSTSCVVKGSILSVTISSVSTVVPNVTNIQDGELQAPGINTTALSDTREQETAGIPDEGHLMADVNYDPSNTVHQWLTSQIGASISGGLTYPNSGPNTMTFTGPLKKWSGSKGDKAGLYKRDMSVHMNSVSRA